MLPSKGFFKKCDCPYFEKGACDRPHCHFRHRKKVLNGPSEEDGQEVSNVEENVAGDNPPTCMVEQQPNHAEQPSTSTSNETNSNAESGTPHDTLFAKLVNQSSSYEKMHRHIPCAYTPTPQLKKPEPKKKTVTGIGGFGDSGKSWELITKARTLLKNYCEENIKKNESKGRESNQTNSAGINLEPKQPSAEHPVSTITSCDDKNIFGAKACDTGFPSQSMQITSGAGKNLESTRINLSFETNSENQDLREIELALRASNLKDNSISVSAKLTKNDENKTEKVTDASVKNSAGNSKNADDELSELDLIKSEIELIKKYLSETNGVEEVKKNEKGKTNREEKENKNKPKRPETHSSGHGSRHRSGHSSSGSKHSSSHSSRHSGHSSSSSRHHTSSSKHHSSSSGRSASDRHSSYKHSGDHHRKKYSEKNGAESQRKRVYRTDRDTNGKSTVSHSKTLFSLGERKKGEEKKKNVREMEVDTHLYTNNKNDGQFFERSNKRKKTEDDENILKNFSFYGCEDLDEDPESIERECFEIFKNYGNPSASGTTKNIQEIFVPSANYKSPVQGKKRTAHTTTVMADHSALRYKTVKKKNNIKSAQDVMFDRYKVAEKARETQEQAPPPISPAPIPGLSRPSVKIAAVSNIQQMLRAKKAIQEKIRLGLKVNERTTISQSVPVGGSRVAHIPNNSNMHERPTIADGSRLVPRSRRQLALEKLLFETNQIYPTKCESAAEAMKLEQEIFRLHSGSATAYHAAFVSLLMKTRRRLALLRGHTSKIVSAPNKAKVSHFDVLSRGKKNFSVIKTKKVDISMLSDKQIYNELLRFKLTPEELKANGFPMSSDRPGYAVCNINFDYKYNEKYLYIKKITGNRRYCIRCSKLYDVDPKTLKQYKEGPETCSFHPGRKKSGGRNCDRIYNCCNSSSTEGCTTHIRHVTDSNNYENYPNCVRTLAKGETNPGVYALDCEMVYSRLGSELARVTVVNLKKEIVYDTLVKPKYPIDCYNTYYSGIEENMLDGVKTTLKDVQAVLLSLFSNKTILIGHSLDSDLRALHLIHDTVVDTSLVFKNEKYFPCKYSLKDLCAKKLSKIIQDNVNGHDSKEDAVAALEIMLQQVKEDVAKYDSLESYEADRGR